MLFFFVLLFTVIFLLKIYEIYSRRKILNVKTGEYITGPSIFYFLWYSIFGKKTLSESLSDMSQGQELFSFFFLHIHLVEVRSPSLAEKLLSDSENFPKKPVNISENLDRFLGKVHVAGAEGDDWKRQRGVLNKSFINLDKYISIFEEKTSEVLKLIKDQDIDDMLQFAQRMTIDVLGKTLLGYEFGALKGTLNPVLESYNYLFKNLVSDTGIALQMLTSNMSFLPWNKVFKEHLDRLDSTKKVLIENSKERMMKSGPQETLSMLDMMVAENLNSKEEFTDEEVWDNISSFFFAGHDSTASALASLTYCLAEYPEIQEKLRTELVSTLNGESIQYSKIKDLQYMNYFVKEVLRMYPPITIITPKIAKTDVKLGDYLIPAGTQVTLNIASLHLSKEIYGDPEVFRPERWSPTEQSKKKIPYYGWLPFSGGNRICIGLQFSLAEQKLFLAHLINNFKITPKEKFHVENDPKKGIVQSTLNYKIKISSL